MCTGPAFRNAVFSAAEFVSNRMLQRLKDKLHYASWFRAGSELKFGLSSSLLAAN